MRSIGYSAHRHCTVAGLHSRSSQSAALTDNSASWIQLDPAYSHVFCLDSHDGLSTSEAGLLVRDLMNETDTCRVFQCIILRTYLSIIVIIMKTKLSFNYNHLCRTHVTTTIHNSTRHTGKYKYYMQLTVSKVYSNNWPSATAS